jgi:hypothetical protein
MILAFTTFTFTLLLHAVAIHRREP